MPRRGIRGWGGAGLVQVTTVPAGMLTSAYLGHYPSEKTSECHFRPQYDSLNTPDPSDMDKRKS